jgi:TPP-dependent indolepyruvate ferredoxin oxidoreductase alpha subunit
MIAPRHRRAHRRFFTSPRIRRDWPARSQGARSPRPPWLAIARLLLLRLPAQHLDQGAGRLARVAGIGCHYMVTWMDRSTATFTHMGGEGVPWVGQAPFTDEKHIFANLGDGTYFHSGLLAIRQAVAAA